MQSIVFSEYGSPDILQFKEVEVPSPKDDEVLVKVHAAAANPLDWHIMRGEPFLARLENGLQKPRITRLGADIAGRVEAVGSKVEEFQPGDEVFGSIFESGLGGFAEYAAVPKNTLALKPHNMTFIQAAAIPIAALTAVQGLRKGRIQSGKKVLINGASGGVGTFGVQIAKSFEAEVTGVCSTRNVNMVRSIGADHVVDYTSEDFTINGHHYDLVFDAVGNRSASDHMRALNPDGICVIAGFTSLSRLFGHMFLGPMMSIKGSKKVGMMETVKTDKQDLLFIKKLIEAGKVVPVIDRCYPLRETDDAIRYLEEGHARGKVIVTVL